MGGVKDPRACLFLTWWDSVLAERGCYLFLLRHWSGCIESLLHRHSRELAFSLIDSSDPVHFSFWQNPTLAARMWLSYCKRILAFSRQNPSKTLLATQLALFAGQPLIEKINQKFAFSLNASAETPFRKDWLRDQANIQILAMLPSTLIAELDEVWLQLLELAELKHEDETPIWDSESTISQSTLDHWISAIRARAKKANIEIKAELDKKLESSQSVGDYIAVLARQESEAFIAKQFTQSIFIQKHIDSDAFAAVLDWCQSQYAKSSEINVALAYWLQRHQQWALAISAWRWCLSLKIVHSYMCHQLATSYQAVGNRDLAFYYIEIAIEKNANNPNFWVFKATLLREAGDFVGALACFKKAAEIAPDKHGIVIPYCDLLEQEGDVEKTIALNNMLLETNPDNNAVQNMAVRLALKMDAKKGETLYIESKLTSLSKLSTEQRNLVLLDYLSKMGCQASEKDLLSRVLEHWVSLGLDVENKYNTL